MRRLSLWRCMQKEADRKYSLVHMKSEVERREELSEKIWIFHYRMDARNGSCRKNGKKRRHKIPLIILFKKMIRGIFVLFWDTELFLILIHWEKEVVAQLWRLSCMNIVIHGNISTMSVCMYFGCTVIIKRYTNGTTKLRCVLLRRTLVILLVQVVKFPDHPFWKHTIRLFLIGGIKGGICKGIILIGGWMHFNVSHLFDEFDGVEHCITSVSYCRYDVLYFNCPVHDAKPNRKEGTYVYIWKGKRNSVL